MKVTEVKLCPTRDDLPYPIDGMSLALWLGLRLRTLWYLIRERGSLYKTHTIPKPKGGVRVLHEPDEKLKFAQRMLLDRVLAKMPTAEHVGAYIDERGVRYTAERHAGHAVIIELDIRNFFPSTTRQFVREFFYKELRWPQESTNLIADILTYPIRKDLSVVPQGAPTSPMLCNLIANQRFDQKILAYLREVDPGWVYTRYSDNIIISHPSPRLNAEIVTVQKRVREIITGSGYHVHPKKIKVMRSNHPKKPQRLLGLTVNKTPNIPVQDYKRLRAQIHTAMTQGFDKVTNVPPSAASPLSHLEGRLTYYLYINPTSEKLLRLKEKLTSLKRARSGRVVPLKIESTSV